MGGYWNAAWPAEDAGPTRQAQARPGLDIGAAERLEVSFRDVVAATMIVQREPGELFLLAHTPGPDGTAWVERIDPVTLETRGRSPDLPGGPVWPGGIAAHADGSLHTVFGRWAHRLGPTLEVEAARRLPRDRPYNSFVVVSSGHLITKDFGKDADEPAELLALDPVTLETVAGLHLPERSIARLSAADDVVYVVGDTHLLRVRWDGAELALDGSFRPRYRLHEGQGYGWDAVIAAGSAWFLDDGEGTERYAGTFVGQGVAEAPLHLVRAPLDGGEPDLVEVCGRPGGIVANPPAVDAGRGIAVAYDSGNAEMAAFRFAPDGGGVDPAPVWRRALAHGGHLVLYPDTGELVVGDHDGARMAEQVVVLDVETGEERARADSGSPLQSVLFPCAGWDRDLYLCTFAGVSRVRVVG